MLPRSLGVVEVSLDWSWLVLGEEIIVFNTYKQQWRVLSFLWISLVWVSSQKLAKKTVTFVSISRKQFSSPGSSNPEHHLYPPCTMVLYRPHPSRSMNRSRKPEGQECGVQLEGWHLDPCVTLGKPQKSTRQMHQCTRERELQPGRRESAKDNKRVNNNIVLICSRTHVYGGNRIIEI